MKQFTIVFKISDNLKQQVIEFYQDRAIQNKPPYSVFQVKDYDCITTLYESGKLMFQGLGADIEASYWIEEERIKNNRDINQELKKDQEKKDAKKAELKDDRFKNIPTIGSDEVGTGDYFGPIVVTSAFVSLKDKSTLYDLGVKDSKKVLDKKIMEIAPTLIKTIPHKTFILTPSQYNKNGITNMNKVKAILHNKVLTELIKENHDYKAVVVDQFCFPYKYFEHINKVPEKTTNITFTTHAEDKCLSVAVASIISRYVFLTEMEKMSKKLKATIPRGASSEVDEFAAEIVKKHGIEKLESLVKLNFKNTDKIKSLIN